MSLFRTRISVFVSALGDSGGPAMLPILWNDTFAFYQIGVVSHGRGKSVDLNYFDLIHCTKCNFKLCIARLWPAKQPRCGLHNSLRPNFVI